MTELSRAPVILLHGIRTYARWQKELGDALSQRQFAHHTHDFGRFGLRRFAWKASRTRRVEVFYDWYCGIRHSYSGGLKSRPDFRPDIIAHSFGTYIVGYGLRKFPDLKFRKIIFCGAILPRDFDWSLPFGRGQVLEVQNDYGVDDVWSRLARRLVGDAGSSGAEGFLLTSPLIRQRRFEEFRHSDYFRPGHYDQWIEFLEEPSVSFRIVRSSSLPPALEWAAVANQARAIDRAVYDVLPGHDTVALPEGLSGQWLRSNPDIYTVLMDNTDRVHGYISTLPVRPEAFDGILVGDLLDRDISPTQVLSYTDNMEVDLYVMSIVIHPDSRRLGDGPEQAAFHRLLFGLIQHLGSLAQQRGIVVRRIGAIAWTDEGVRLCEIMGMTRTGAEPCGHPAFLIDLHHFDEARRVHRLLRGLRQTYARLKRHQS